MDLRHLGALHGVGLSIERWWGELRVAAIGERGWSRSEEARHVPYVCLGWVLFRSDSSPRRERSSVGSVMGSGPSVTPAVVILVAGSLAVQYLPADSRLRLRTAFSRYGGRNGGDPGCLLLVIDALGPEVAPFIYSSSDMTGGSTPQSIPGDQGCPRVE